MKMNITARHFKAPDKLKIFIENEINRLEKFFDNIIDCDVILDYIRTNNSKQSVEIRMKVYGQVLSVSAISDDMYKSVDLAVGKLERKLKKYKARLRSFSHEKAVLHVMEGKAYEEE